MFSANACVADNKSKTIKSLVVGLKIAETEKSLVKRGYAPPTALPIALAAIATMVPAAQ